MAEVDILHQKYHSLHKSPQIENFNDANDAIFKFGFLCAKTEETEVCLDPLPKTFENLCFVKSNISQVKLSNASIKELDIREARFDCLELLRCEILGKSNLSGSIKRFLFNDCINTNILRIALEDTEEVSLKMQSIVGEFILKTSLN